MDVMRANQKRMAQSLANAGRVDTRDVKKTLAVVPFRHSKLTEILMDYFVGDGRVVNKYLVDFLPWNSPGVSGNDCQREPVRYWF